MQPTNHEFDDRSDGPGQAELQSQSGLQTRYTAVLSELASCKQTIVDLEDELSETNRGVVALYAELDAYGEQLKEASELKSRFLTYMSHEFRTPLGAIQSIARILLDRMDGPLTAEQEKQIRFIEKASVELTDMVNDLLDLAKIEAGKVSIAPAFRHGRLVLSDSRAIQTHSADGRVSHLR